MQKSDLPFGSEFSPSQIELPALLDLAMTYAGYSGVAGAEVARQVAA